MIRCRGYLGASRKRAFLRVDERATLFRASDPRSSKWSANGDTVSFSFTALQAATIPLASINHGLLQLGRSHACGRTSHILDCSRIINGISLTRFLQARRLENRRMNDRRRDTFPARRFSRATVLRNSTRARARDQSAKLHETAFARVIADIGLCVPLFESPLLSRSYRAVFVFNARSYRIAYRVHELIITCEIAVTLHRACEKTSAGWMDLAHFPPMSPFSSRELQRGGVHLAIIRGFPQGENRGEINLTTERYSMSDTFSDRS